MKNAVFWDVTQCGSCKNPEDGIIYALYVVTLGLISDPETGDSIPLKCLLNFNMALKLRSYEVGIKNKHFYFQMLRF
jgi:hypothetical protein